MRNSKKELVDKEINLYKSEQYLLANNDLRLHKDNIEKQKLVLDKELVEYKTTHFPELNGLAKLAAEQSAKYEHEFHSVKEAKGIELAKLEAKAEAMSIVVEARNEVVAADTNLYESQKKEIDRLTAIINSLIEKIPTDVTVNNKH